MGTVHKLLEEKGRQGVLSLGTFERAEVEAASAYLSDEDTALGYLYSGWCQAALPHKRQPDDAPWVIRGDRISLMVEPGRRIGPSGDPVLVGVPYGSLRAKDRTPISTSGASSRSPAPKAKAGTLAATFS